MGTRVGGAAQGENRKLPSEISTSDPLSREEYVPCLGTTCRLPWLVFPCFQMGNGSYLFLAHTWGDAHEPARGLSPSKQTHFLQRRFLFTAREMQEPQGAHHHQRVPSTLASLVPESHLCHPLHPSLQCGGWRESWILASPCRPPSLFASFHSVAELSRRWMGCQFEEAVGRKKRSGVSTKGMMQSGWFCFLHLGLNSNSVAFN